MATVEVADVGEDCRFADDVGKPEVDVLAVTSVGGTVAVVTWSSFAG